MNRITTPFTARATATEVLAGGPQATFGVVATWSLDPADADRLWEYAASAL